MSKQVCVIGAGPSGITAAKNLLDEGLQVTVYDLGKEVGGNWVFNENEGHSSVFETTHIISSKKLSEYEDYPDAGMSIRIILHTNTWLLISRIMPVISIYIRTYSFKHL